MNILFDSAIAVSLLLAPVVGLQFQMHRKKSLLYDGVRLRNDGRYKAAEPALIAAADGSSWLSRMGFEKTLATAGLQLAWLFVLTNRHRSAVELLTKLQSGAAAPELLPLILEARIWVQLQTGETSSTKALLDEALALVQSDVQLSRSISAASLLYTQAWLCMREFELSRAESLLQRSQSLLMSSVGAKAVHHIPVLLSQSWIAVQRGNTQEANRMLAHALKTYGPLLGRWHPRMAHLIALLGAVAFLENDRRLAREYIDVSAKILKAQDLMQTPCGLKVSQALQFLQVR